MLVLRFSTLEIEVESLEVFAGCTQLATSVTVFVAHALENAYKGPSDLVKDTELLFLTAAFIASCFGLTVSPLFFCFHLLDIVNKSMTLQAVFRAVTLNGTSILLTAIFGFIVIWIYAILGYAFLAGDSGSSYFLSEDGVDMCPDVLTCWISSLSNGLRAGDLGDPGVMMPTSADDPMYPVIVLYQFSYYIIVITILLNVIFGIIIDTFGEHHYHPTSY